MFNGIYCSNTGLNAMQSKMEVVANNVANCNTEGFKQGQISFKPFLAEKYGVMVDQTATDFRVSGLKQTGRAYDFAIQGEGFFKINTSQGQRYTRSGSFSSDGEGYLVDRNGNRVAGVNGPIKMVAGKPDQQFALASFQHPEYLVPTGMGWSDPGQGGIGEAGQAQVQQGFLETSNVDMLMNMTDMISTARYFSLNSRMLMSQDEMVKKAAEEIGMLK